ncbi:YajQ family cyclic di-GMP-binding protein [Candidatus Pelagibacter bacterium nBUS_30]|uniref:YajQ family cyclic di-GMP-binding protein n=1 Tax=unclassified Candidatus Pelagibacter TaxID=2647897 RepID=UPI003EBEAE34
MPSFDVISKINYPEFDNALANCLREITNRYDFKGLNISIERKDKTITTIAPDELKLKQVNELLQVHLIRRKVDPRVITIKNSESAAGTTIRQVSELKEGISQENAKKIIADVKKLKLKIQIKIQGEELRAEGKKRDNLQEAISAIEAIDIGLPIEFVNFRD